MPPTNTEKFLSELNDKIDVLIKVVSIQVGADKTLCRGDLAKIKAKLVRLGLRAGG